jgi:haloalkane dehalogenase
MNTWAWPVDRDPYYIAFSGFMGGPLGRLLIRRYNFLAGTMMRRLFGDKGKLTAAAHQQYLRALATPEDRQGVPRAAEADRRVDPWLREVWAGVPRLKDKPTLIIWGMKDIAFRRKELARWEEALSGARMVRLPSVGHFVQEEAPDQLAAAVVSFLKETAVS